MSKFIISKYRNKMLMNKVYAFSPLIIQDKIENITYKSYTEYNNDIKIYTERIKINFLNQTTDIVIKINTPKNQNTIVLINDAICETEKNKIYIDDCVTEKLLYVMEKNFIPFTLNNFYKLIGTLEIILSYGSIKFDHKIHIQYKPNNFPHLLEFKK